AGAGERVEHQVAGAGAGADDALQERQRLFGAVQLLAVAALLARVAAADRELPDAAHLLAAVLLLQLVVVEGVAARILLALGGPDQLLVRVAEAHAAEVRSRVELLPDHAVEHPV